MHTLERRDLARGEQSVQCRTAHSEHDTSFFGSDDDALHVDLPHVQKHVTEIGTPDQINE